MPEHLAKSAEIVREYHHLKRRQHLLWRMNAENEQGDCIKGTLIQLAELEKDVGFQEAGANSLRERAYKMRFNQSVTPPPDELCMVIGDVPIAARGNLTAIQGKAKVGKSAMIAAILGAVHRGNLAAQGDTFQISWKGESTGAIVHLDTEQSLSDWHSLVARGITRSGVLEASARLVSLPLVMFSRSERLALLREILTHESKAQGGIDCVILDGVADLCTSPNDEGEALELISKIHSLSQEFKCPVFCVLHENPGTEFGKTRGHLGSELNRKAFANIRLDKDAETSLTTIYGTDMRKRDLPKEHGFCFGWDDQAGMHTFQGRAAGLKSAIRDEKAATEAEAYWVEIFSLIPAEGGNDPISGKISPFPSVSIKRAQALDGEIPGNEKPISYDTMKKRLQKAEALGVLRKTAINEWKLSARGKRGMDGESC